MKKKLLVSIIFLISSLVSYSQTLSKRSDDCLVPCSAVRNALVMKEYYDILILENEAKKDSMIFISQMNNNLNILLSNKNKEIDIMKENQKVFENIISIKDEKIDNQKKQIKILRTQKFVSYLITTSALALSGYIIITN